MTRWSAMEHWYMPQHTQVHEYKLGQIDGSLGLHMNKYQVSDFVMIVTFNT